MDAQLNQLVKPLENMYKSAPALPVSAKELLVSFAPWVALIFGALTLLAGVGGLGVFTVLSPFAALYGGVGYSAFLIVSSIIVVVEGVVMLLAFSPLKKRLMRGWNLMVWTEVLALLSSVVTLRVGSIVGAVIGAAIAFYLLFQMKSYYK